MSAPTTVASRGKESECAVPDDLEHSPSQPSSTASEAKAKNDGLPSLQMFAIMAAVTMGACLMHLDNSILVTAIPKITTQYQSIGDIGWYGAAYQFASAVLQPITGKLYANFRTKWTYITFIAIFELGSLVCATATSSKMLIAGRAVAGAGVSGMQNGCFIIIALCAPLHRRPKLIGIVQSISYTGLVCGPLLGGLFTEYATWRWCFYINIPCGAVVVLLLCCIRITESAPKPPPLSVLRNLHHQLDLVGFFLLAPACVMLLLAAYWGGNQYAFDSSRIIGLFVGAGCGTLVWLAWDWYKKDSAMIPLAMLSQRHVWTGCLTFGLIMGPAYVSTYYLPTYFQSVKGYSPTLSGVYMLPSIIAQIVGATVSGKLVPKVGYFLPFCLFGGVLMATGYGLSSTFAANTSIGKWIGYQILFGAGRGLAIQMPIVAVQHSVEPAQIPIVLATLVFSGSLISALALSFSETIFNNSLQDILNGLFSASTATDIVNSGEQGFRGLVTTDQLPQVLSAYATSVDRVFYFAAAMTALCFFTSFGLGFKDIRRQKAPSEKDSNEQESSDKELSEKESIDGDKS